MTKKIVHRVDDGMNRQEILCTTYQMRNFYRQLGDGFFSTLDVMNYIQHHQITKWVKKGNWVLDVCCGRGLMLPLLRYGNKELGGYVGVDIAPNNAIFLNKRVTDNKPLERNYYEWPVEFVESNVAEMSNKLSRKFHVIIYTSAIEHMHKDDGLKSLQECRKVTVNGGTMILTCPNTPESQDGYDTQYRAHVYEWKRSELLNGLKQTGWKVVTEYGLLHDKETLIDEMEKVGGGKLLERVSKFVPNEWLIPVFSPMFPQSAKEIGFVCQAV